MTDHKKFKEVIRQRVAKTGESYTTARMMLLAEGGVQDEPPRDAAADSEQAPVPEMCPGCRKNPADPRGPYFLCPDCEYDKAGFDHSPDYWD
jgi:hypothetical protein